MHFLRQGHIMVVLLPINFTLWGKKWQCSFYQLFIASLSPNIHTKTYLIHKLLYICFNSINLQIHSELNFCQQKLEQQLKNIHLTSTISGRSQSKVDSTIQQINLYPVDSAIIIIGFPNTYLLDINLSSR